MSSLAEEIKIIRKKIGLSARSFAKAVGSNVCSIYNFENGRSEPKNKSIMKRARDLYALFLELSNDADYLVKITDSYETAKKDVEELKKINKKVLEMLKDDKTSIFDVIKYLEEKN